MDISFIEINPLTKYYKNDESFSCYFNQNLSTENAPEGFLEELDRLIQINKVRKIIMEVDSESIKQAEVLVSYLSILS